MKINWAWILDPKTKEPSVSLTLLVLSSLIFVVTMGLEMFDVIQKTSMTFEFFGSSAALYFGRRISFNGKNFSSEKEEEKK